MSVLTYYESPNDKTVLHTNAPNGNCQIVGNKHYGKNLDWNFDGGRFIKAYPTAGEYPCYEIDLFRSFACEEPFIIVGDTCISYSLFSLEYDVSEFNQKLETTLRECKPDAVISLPVEVLLAIINQKQQA
jgi:hypothetical protein